MPRRASASSLGRLRTYAAKNRRFRILSPVTEASLDRPVRRADPVRRLDDLLDPMVVGVRAQYFLPAGASDGIAVLWVAQEVLDLLHPVPATLGRHELLLGKKPAEHGDLVAQLEAPARQDL